MGNFSDQRCTAAVPVKEFQTKIKIKSEINIRKFRCMTRSGYVSLSSTKNANKYAVSCVYDIVNIVDSELTKNDK